ncbi:pyridoxamine 5'-phosphate oxidase family protein [Paeniglutamicibacter kerguelensis]|uniref:Nitroimidazol reductase NimA-like FMN-containing flavoprotein (Pyridoxamine 5'-phosphate oxidase superfamily) n=1 Tax=Paeniglutamicibacter kerguelensis TaxID=254788 RepID=A0ABS4X896_9MICC|nr:pyridoxamine 5'-phosphate oxidase family protein [Paeniglutamicibacter kerguelensis]MBP2384690.1 nitroimidazol reductase NimA-like FMN-containing flavoprotein (pyridoxamine 5'-phosphate oxidase superfamily) [Paeniglutamicibacter kerguelensis]
MMFEHDDDQPILILDDDQSWRLLEHTNHGRLATAVGGIVDIFPLNYAAKDRVIYIRTAPGEKLAALTVNGQVAFEADGILSDQAWSVVVHGTAHRLETQAEIAAARESGVSPWIPTQKESWVKIQVEKISGRHFHLGAQPEAGDAV